MADELNIALDQTGLATLVGRIYTPGFTQVGGDVAMSEVGGPSGLYTGSAPAATLGRGEYHVVFFDTAGSPDTVLGRGRLLWDDAGDKEVEELEGLLDIWQDRGLDPDQAKTITEQTAQTDYDEDAGAALHKDVTKVGTLTTITRS